MVKTGLWMSLLALLGGIWVALMPSLVGFQPASGDPWTTPTLVSVLLGLGIVLAALVGLVGFYGLKLKEQQTVLRQEARRRAWEKARAASEPPGPTAAPRAVAEARPEDRVRKLSRVERTAAPAPVARVEPESSDAALRQLAQTILQDLQRTQTH
jgi:hypothetical protein